MKYNNVRPLQEIIDSDNFQNLEEVRTFVSFLHSSCYPYEQIVEKLKSKHWYFSEADIIKNKIIPVLITMATSQKYRNNPQQIILYKSEMKILSDITQPLSRKFLYAALIQAKQNYHHSGWIKYDRDSFFNVWKIKTLTEKEKVEAVNICYDKGLIDFRVIGSKNPLVCYQVPFMAFEGEIQCSILEEDKYTQFYYILFGD